jgi:hypothetical protein
MSGIRAVIRGVKEGRKVHDFIEQFEGEGEKHVSSRTSR